MEIETPRLFLRRLDVGDLTPICDLFADPSVRRYLAVGELRGADVRSFAAKFIHNSRREFARTGSGAMALVTRAGAVTIGYCGLRPLPDREAALELLYALAPRYWGQGLASEAALSCLDWGFGDPALAEILGLAMPQNQASRRVMEKLGMTYEEMTDRYYNDWLCLYRMTRRRWALAKERTP